MLAGERLAVNNKAEPPEARPVRAGDIALLFRSMTQVPEYENALRAFGIDYYLVGGRGYFAQQEIYDVLHLLRTLENPRDTLSLVGVLRSPFCCVSDEAIFLLNRAAEGIWEAWHRQPSDLPVPDDQSATVARARHHLLRWREAKDRLRIADLLRLAIAESGYDAALRLEFLGERKLANLWKLIDMAREFDRSGRFGLADFIARLSDIVAEQPREEQAATLPEGADVVRIMSVHQAKGLEFPVVIVPDINRGLGQGSYPSAVWHATLGCVARPPDEAGDRLFSEFGKQLLDRLEGLLDWDEELRTLYVVCTRAADHLILSGAIKPEDLNQEQPITRSPWMDALSRRFHLRSGVCLDPAIAAEFNPEVRVLEQLPLTDRPQRPESAGSGALPAFEPANLEPVAVAQPALVALSAVQQAIAAETDSEVIAWSEHYDAEDGQDLNDWEELILPGELREEIEAASEVRYRFDFVLVFDAALPSVVGRIEALWTDRAGEQHLLLCAGADVRTTVAAAVEAVRRQLGEPPATVAVLAGGGITRLPPAEWNVAEGLDSLQRALTARARPPRLA
jgi:ATP-dependent helicase/nuclease subunit A